MKKRKSHRRHRRHTMKHNPAGKHTRRHGVKRHSRRRHNPAASLTSGKFSIGTSVMNLGITVVGFIGNSIVKTTISPLIPGYSSLTGIATTIADGAIAVGIPFGLYFLLPMIGLKKNTAAKASTYLAIGMLTNVIARQIASTSTGVSARMIPNKTTGMGAIVRGIPVNKSYGLSANVHDIFGKLPTYAA